MPPFLQHLNTNDFQPQFHWQLAQPQAADAINLPHEDYPARVPATIRAISLVMHLASQSETPPRITNSLISLVHRTVFPDHGERAGRYRQYNVTVGTARPPDWQRIPTLMQQLEAAYLPLELTLQTLRHWNTTSN